MQQLGFDGMPRRLYPCTPTRLGTWLGCPRRYRMNYLDRPPPGKGPPWAHNSLGASVHNALAGWWRLPREQRTVSAAAELLERGWIEEGFAGPGQSAACRRWAADLVTRYVTGLDPATEPAGVERTVATRTEVIAVSGRIDRLDRRRAADGSGHLAVVDYKTGRRTPTVDDTRTSLPLALYAIAAERTLRQPCRRVELHHLPTGRVLAWDHTPESMARQLRRAEDIAAECAVADELFRGTGPGATPSPAGQPGAVTSPAGQPGAVTSPAGQGSPESSAAGQGITTPAGSRLDDIFPPRPGPLCSWCDYRARCPEGSAASEPRKPWDGLAQAASADTAGPPDAAGLGAAFG
jgi:putative RecB family exonuclease